MRKLNALLMLLVVSLFIYACNDSSAATNRPMKPKQTVITYRIITPNETYEVKEYKKDSTGVLSFIAHVNVGSCSDEFEDRATVVNGNYTIQTITRQE